MCIHSTLVLDSRTGFLLIVPQTLQAPNSTQRKVQVQIAPIPPQLSQDSQQSNANCPQSFLNSQHNSNDVSHLDPDDMAQNGVQLLGQFHTSRHNPNYAMGIWPQI